MTKKAIQRTKKAKNSILALNILLINRPKYKRIIQL